MHLRWEWRFAEIQPQAISRSMVWPDHELTSASLLKHLKQVCNLRDSRRLLDELDVIMCNYEARKFSAPKRGRTRELCGSGLAHHLAYSGDVIVVPMSYDNELDLSANVDAKLTEILDRDWIATAFAWARINDHP